jgi:hypothetical protein
VFFLLLCLVELSLRVQLFAALQHAIHVLPDLNTGAGSVPVLGTPFEDTDFGGRTRSPLLAVQASAALRFSPLAVLSGALAGSVPFFGTPLEDIDFGGRTRKQSFPGLQKKLGACAHGSTCGVRMTDTLSSK